MKKITYLFTFLISITGFSQNLVTNGDFQTGTAAPWTGNAANVVDLGASNWVNQANVTVAGNPWDANLSQVVNLTSGKIYKLKFDAFTAAATGTRTLISGLGQTAAPFVSLTSTSVLTATPQTFSFDITINYGEAVTDRVIFDMGNATGFVFIDNVSVVEVMPLIQNFETPVTYTSAGGFEGATASFAADPASGGTNGQVFKGVQGPGGNPWQGIEFVQTTKKAKLTTNKTMTVDVYCSQAFNLLAKVAQGGVAPESANGQAYTTPGQWQTITFNFAAPMDGTAAANGEYQKIIFFGNWKATNDGFNSPIVPLTFYIDNIRAEEAPIITVLPIIQNFETPITYTSLNGFEGAAASIAADPVSGGTNGQVLKGIQGPGGNPWQGIEFVQTAKKAKLTTNKTMTAEVYCSQAFNLLAKVDIGGVGIASSATGQAYTTPGQWQTLTFNFAVPMDGTAVANGEYEKIIFFGNWKATNDGFNTPIVPLTFYINNIRAEEAAIITPPAGPSVAAPTPPARPIGEFISLFSNAYTNIAVSEWSTSWDDSSFLDLFSVPGDDIKKITFGNFLGVQFTNYENATNMTHFHMDYFISAGTDLTSKVLNPKWSNHAGMTGETNALLLTHLPTTAGSWVSVDMPLSMFSPQGPGTAFAREKLYQFLLSSNLGIVYVDNIYLHKNTVLSTGSFAVSKVKLYPNPTSNVLNIASVGTIQNIAIFNVLGQEVMNKLANETLVSLDVSGLSAGVYVIKTVIDGKVSSTKFIKE